MDYFRSVEDILKEEFGNVNEDGKRGRKLLGDVYFLLTASSTTYPRMTDEQQLAEDSPAAYPQLTRHAEEDNPAKYPQISEQPPLSLDSPAAFSQQTEQYLSESSPATYPQAPKLETEADIIFNVSRFYKNSINRHYSYEI
jgi:hypothetical protein